MDEDGGAALDGARSWASTKTRWLATWESLPPVLHPYQEDIARAAKGHDFAEHLSVGASHKQTVSDDFMAAVAIAGTPGHVASRLQEFVKLDVDRITLTLLSGGRMEHLRLLCEEVLPRVNHSGAEAPAPLK